MSYNSGRLRRRPPIYSDNHHSADRTSSSSTRHKTSRNKHSRHHSANSSHSNQRSTSSLSNYNFLPMIINTVSETAQLISKVPDKLLNTHFQERVENVELVTLDVIDSFGLGSKEIDNRQTPPSTPSGRDTRQIKTRLRFYPNDYTSQIHVFKLSNEN